MIVERLENPANWDEELEFFQGGIFMTSAWLSLVSNNERKTVYLRFIEDNKPVALLGGIEFFIKKGGTKQLFFYSGIASKAHESALIKRCKIALYEYARKNGYQRISLRSLDHHSYVNANVKQFKERKTIEYVFHLDKEWNSITNGFSKEVRRRARKAKKEGAVIKNSYSPIFIDVLFKLINETYNIRQSKGYGPYVHFYLPFISRHEIEKLLNNRHASLFFTELKGEILSMNLVFTFKDKACSFLMGTSRKGYKVGSPSFHYYELVGMLKYKGYSYYNIGGIHRSIKHQGLRKFKDSLGAEIINSAEEATNFISPPLSFLNPLLELKGFLRDLKYFPFLFKKPIIFVYNLTLKRIDKY